MALLDDRWHDNTWRSTTLISYYIRMKTNTHAYTCRWLRGWWQQNRFSMVSKNRWNVAVLLLSAVSRQSSSDRNVVGVGRNDEESCFRVGGVENSVKISTKTQTCNTSQKNLQFTYLLSHNYSKLLRFEDTIRNIDNKGGIDIWLALTTWSVAIEINYYYRCFCKVSRQKKFFVWLSSCLSMCSF